MERDHDLDAPDVWRLVGQRLVQGLQLPDPTVREVLVCWAGDEKWANVPDDAATAFTEGFLQGGGVMVSDAL